MRLQVFWHLPIEVENPRFDKCMRCCLVLRHVLRLLHPKTKLVNINGLLELNGARGRNRTTDTRIFNPRNSDFAKIISILPDITCDAERLILLYYFMTLREKIKFGEIFLTHIVSLGIRAARCFCSPSVAPESEEKPCR